MRKVLFVLFSIFSVSVSGQLPIVFEKSYGGTFEDQPFSIKMLAGGDLVSCGYTYSANNDFNDNHGIYDGFIFRIKPNGDTVWTRCYGGNNEDFFHDMVVIGNSIYCAGRSNSNNNGDVPATKGDVDVWVIKVDAATGNIIWSKTFGGSLFEIAWGLNAASNNRIIVSGRTTSSNGDITNNNGSYDCWAFVLDSNGNMLRQKTFGGSSAEIFNKMMPVSNNRYLFVGSSQSVNGDLTINKGSRDAWVVMTDSALQIVWQKSFGGSKFDEAVTVAEKSDGNYLIAGYSVSKNGDLTGVQNTDTVNGNIWLFTVTPNGNIINQKCHGGSDYDYPNEIIKVSDKIYLVAAETYSDDGDITNKTGNDGDFWLLDIDSSLSLVHEQVAGSSGSEYEGDVLMDNEGNIWINTAVAAASRDVSSIYGQSDVWIAKLCADIDSTLTTSGFTLTANHPYAGATYQWVDCNTNTPISGATSVSYTATANGSYAVVITNSCNSQKTECKAITGVSVNNMDTDIDISDVYPNPNNGTFSLSLPQGAESITAMLTDILGKQIAITTQRDNNKLIISAKQVSAGMYLLTIVVDGRITHRRVVVR